MATACPPPPSPPSPAQADSSDGDSSDGDSSDSDSDHDSDSDSDHDSDSDSDPFPLLSDSDSEAEDAASPAASPASASAASQLPDGATAKPASLGRSSTADPRIYDAFDGLLGRVNGKIAMQQLGSLPNSNGQPCTPREMAQLTEECRRLLASSELLGQLPVAASARGEYEQCSTAACASVAASGQSSLLNLATALRERVLAADGITAPPAGTKGGSGPYLQLTSWLDPHCHGRGGLLELITPSLMRQQAMGMLCCTVCVRFGESGLVLEDTGVPGSSTMFRPSVPIFVHMMGPSGDGHQLLPQRGRLLHGVTRRGELLEPRPATYIFQVGWVGWVGWVGGGAAACAGCAGLRWVGWRAPCGIPTVPHPRLPSAASLPAGDGSRAWPSW